ncbi:MAG: penicillin acylase family protein [Proteobacteria bacterium]|nr:penicillin acylase family protein [Pseudomonadota bacterium]
MRLVKKLLLGVFLTILMISGGVYLFLESKQPQRSGTIELSGLSQAVEVHYDRWAVPHIYASNEKDLFQALGYVHAQDRLFQMEMLRRLAKGQLAEILGSSLVKTDKFFRTLRIKQFSEEFAAELKSDEKYLEATKAYLSGINQFIAHGITPIEFHMLGIPSTKFTIADIIALGGYMSYSFASGFKTDPLLTFIKEKLGQEYLKDLDFNLKNTLSSSNQPTYETSMVDLVAVVGEIESFTATLGMFEGSNAWAISGKHTKSGKPILAGDPHMAYAFPSIWYEAHLVAPEFDLYGHHLAGVPFALLGHNRDSAWSLTMFKNDDVDFFKERVNPENKDQVWHKDRWVELIIEHEIIKVKGEKDVKLKVRRSHHGPIINDIVKGIDKKGSPVSVWWGFYLKSNKVLQTFYEMGRAKSVNDAAHAVKKLYTPGLNIMFANSNGDIAWWAAAKIPIRPDHVNPNFILDGASGKDDYLGFQDFSRNPQSVNPAAGYLVSANHQPQNVENGVPPGYYNSHNRVDRINELIRSSNQLWTIEATKEMQLDNLSREDTKIRDIVMSVLGSNMATQKDGISEKALELLGLWDGKSDLNSIGASIFHQFYFDLMTETLLDELGRDYLNAFLSTQFQERALLQLLTKQHSRWWDNVKTKMPESRNYILIKAWEKTVATLVNTLGPKPEEWFWSKVHTLEQVHAIGRKKPFDQIFNLGPRSVPGAQETINKSSFKPGPGTHKVTTGPSTRRVIDFIDLNNTQGINPTGQAGFFFNKNSNDQFDMYVKGQYRKQLFEEKEIKQSGTSHLKLLPKP